MYYQEYDPDILRQVQAIERMILSDFNALCEKYGIDYFAGGGTAIGAVRHQGMIPWDDDIDVNLLRPDFEKFLAVAESEYGDKYALVNASTDSRYPLMSTRWVLQNTTFRDFHARSPWAHQGFFLDVYCFENLADDDSQARRQWRMAWFWGKLMTLRLVPSPTHALKGWRGWLLTQACRCGSVLLHRFTSQAFLLRQIKRYALCENEHDTHRVAWFFDTVPFLSVMNRSDIFPTRSVPFDDTTIRLPANAEAYLSLRFGDYMTLPPPEKRHNHPPLALDFGPYAKPTADTPKPSC